MGSPLAGAPRAPVGVAGSGPSSAVGPLGPGPAQQRNPLFEFVFDGPLFRFRLKHPFLGELSVFVFQLPPRRNARRHACAGPGRVHAAPPPVR